LEDELAPLASALAFLSDGRYRAAAPSEPAAVAVVLPRSGSEIRELREQYPDRDIVVWDRAEGAAPKTIVDDLGAGADVYVTGASVLLLVSYLDALQRRRRDRATG
jgi:hypothetical protein